MPRARVAARVPEAAVAAGEEAAKNLRTPDFKTLVTTGRVAPLDVHLAHARSLRPSVAPGDSLLDRVARSFKHRLDVAFGEIPHPAGKA